MADGSLIMLKIQATTNAHFGLRRIQSASHTFLDINRDGAQEIGRLYREQARAYSPVKSGKLRNSWKYRTQANLDGSDVKVSIFTDDPSAVFKLYRTRPHVIKPKPGNEALSFGRQVVAEIHHPGTKGIDIFKLLRSDVSLQTEILFIFDRSLKRLADKL